MIKRSWLQPCVFCQSIVRVTNRLENILLWIHHDLFSLSFPGSQGVRLPNRMFLDAVKTLQWTVDTEAQASLLHLFSVAKFIYQDIFGFVGVSGISFLYKSHLP